MSFNSIDWGTLAQELYPKPKPKSFATEQMKTVLSIAAGGQSIELMPSEMFIVTAEELDVGLPIQVQLEIIPTAPMAYTANAEDFITERMYVAKIVSVKARVKPGTTAFTMEEQKQIDHIINETEDSVQQKKREMEFMKKIKAAEKEPNRFTGLEI